MPPELDYTSMSTDIIIKGSLRKAKNWNKRFFVLRDGSPAKLEYYESERKWKSSNSKPKRRINLENPWNISKKKDQKHDFLIVIFTEDDYFSMAADNADTQERWVNALQRAVKPEPGTLLFQHMWQVVLENKELEKCSGSLLARLHGPHRVCLTHDEMVFVHVNSNGGGDRTRRDPIEIRITSIRVCGHKEGMFFIEPGRASGIGNGKLWMDLNDEAMAANMHQTILKIMYTLNQEEANGARGRSYSSGSNSGRMRRSVMSVRSHHNNPPPSQIGMGKMASVFPSTHNRIRCDSLPAPHVSGLSDSRLRTGSEGETTMHRPLRANSMRYAPGSTSPGMRSRLLYPQGRRGTSYCCHFSNSSHSHTTSLPGSCNASSTASSNEHLNTALSVNSDFSSSANGVITHLPPSASSPVISDGIPAEESSTDGQCTTQGPLQMLVRNGSISRIQRNNANSNSRCPTPEFPFSTTTPPIHEHTVSNRHYCTMCLAHIPYSHTHYDSAYIPLKPSDLAPPPPETEPPPNPLHNQEPSTSSNHDYANVSAHCRSQSLDDSLSCGTSASSLSTSPHQTGTLLNGNQNPNKSQGGSNPSSHDSVQDDGNSFPLDDYTSMDFDGTSKYPHQKAASTSHKSSNPNVSFLAKLVSLTGVSSSSRSGNNSPDLDYTPMNPRSSSISSRSDSSANQKKSQLETLQGYVPMKSFTMKSLPQSIGCRRRSVPENSHSRWSPPYGYSPDKTFEPMNPARNYCQDCNDRLTSQIAIAEESSYCSMLPGALKRTSKSSTESGSDIDKDSCVLAKSTSTTCCTDSMRSSTPSPTLKAADEYQNMPPLQQDVGLKRTDSMKTDASDSNLSIASCFSADNDLGGYLPMGPNHHTRKTLYNSILSVAAEHHNQAGALAPQYPHQRKPTQSLNSTDRPSKSSRRSKRPLSLGFRHTIGNSTRRSQSLKLGKKISKENSPLSQDASPPASSVSSQPPLSPGGDYVNIDFTKAQEQMQSPFVVNVRKSKEELSSPVLQLRRIGQAGPEYTVMNFNPMVHRTLQANS